jgi:type I restriction enzyme M protein
LRKTNGKAGNGSLRDALNWDETTYNAVKDDLVSSGRLLSGKGRGGSVSLLNA